jgi:phosphoacetylglucosamine mutase
MSKSLQSKFKEQVKIGIICTAYSNGNFINFIKGNLEFELLIAKTGVKHLHLKAKKFDIAVYFESNGHGTTYSSEEVFKKIQKLNCFVESSTDSQILELISIFLSMFNRTTGDSLSVLIGVESCLKFNNMSLLDLYETYSELPSVNLKAIVKDKNIFIANEDESRLVQPESLQILIDEEVRKITKGRCFVRPSGTEDILRIYSEACSFEEAQNLAQIISNYIHTNYNI